MSNILNGEGIYFTSTKKEAELTVRRNRIFLLNSGVCHLLLFTRTNEYLISLVFCKFLSMGKKTQGINFKVLYRNEMFHDHRHSTRQDSLLYCTTFKCRLGAVGVCGWLVLLLLDCHIVLEFFPLNHSKLLINEN